jgi:hypothetical protein
MAFLLVDSQGGTGHDMARDRELVRDLAKPAFIVAVTGDKPFIH